MLLPIDWMKQFVAVDEPAEKVAERFTELGFECELISDNLIDLDVTPNRGDVLSILGLAREYAAATNQKLTMPQVASLEKGSDLPGVTLTANPKAFHRLSAIVVKDVAMSPSPDWLRQAVESVGMNSINTVVDLTNYVMFELGLPMHAFDLDQITGGQLNLRLSQPGEKFTSLKDEVVDLPAEAIVVESNGEIIDLVGIRGGKSSMITPETKNLLVWGLSLPRPLIRQMVKKTGLRTEGAYRHERETDWLMTEPAIARFIYLLQEVSGGHVSSVLTKEATPINLPVISWQKNQVNQLLGTNYTDEQIVDSLVRLGFTIEGEFVHVPSWRMFDVTRPEDLIEEVARIQGYSQLPRAVITNVDGPAETLWAKIENLKDQLAEAGFTEVYTESFSGRAETEILGFDDAKLDVLANPVNRDFAFCRPSIIPNLIKILALNAWADDAAIFEIANVFPAKMLEETVVTIAASGKQQQRLAQWVPADSIQVISVDHPLAKLYKLRRPAVIAQVPAHSILDKATSTFATDLIKPNYRPVSAFPPSVRDIAIVIDQSIDPSTVITTVYDIASDHVVLVELFDQFRSDKFGPNKQSLAFHIIYQAIDKTLDTAEVDEIHQKVVDAIIQKYQAELR